MKPDEIRELAEEVVADSVIGQRSALNREGGKDLFSEVLRMRTLGLAAKDGRVADWWSPRRDLDLFQWLLRSDVLVGAIFNTSARLSSIPVSIQPVDESNRNHRRQAMYSDALLQNSWSEIAMPFAIDWQSQDNGAFVEILGAGNPAGPIEPTRIPETDVWVYGTGLAVLDSQRCRRTGDEKYPVVYTHKDPKTGAINEYKLHNTRVYQAAQMPFARAGMNGVGYSGISRCLEQVRRLNNIGLLEEEMTGARPPSQIVFSRGIHAEDVEAAFELADTRGAVESDDKRRSSRLVFISATGAADSVRSTGLETINLTRYPEQYNQETYFNIAVNVLAMCLGFDSREFWPATVRGATRADAEVQHWKSMKKTPGLWMDSHMRNLSRMWCGSNTKPKFGGQDDEQDSVRADIRLRRAQYLQILIETGMIDHEISFQIQLAEGDLTDEQYLHMLVANEERKKIEERSRKLAEEAAKPAPVASRPAPGGGQED